MKNFQQFDGAYGKFLKIKSGAGNQVRTGDLNLGKVLSYQSCIPYSIIKKFQKAYIDEV